MQRNKKRAQHKKKRKEEGEKNQQKRVSNAEHLLFHLFLYKFVICSKKKQKNKQ